MAPLFFPHPLRQGFVTCPPRVALPGALPFAFARRVGSGHTAGRFFGPSWSSTVDEHLEIDVRGVVHVTDDGLLPAPRPGLPTLPESDISSRPPPATTRSPIPPPAWASAAST
ncbi:DUF6531 domain-containing protein [Streptomyces sp. NPDC058872]|uniref:DUF6531 domain-containing protein n=1 Tax=Streptomyces sp. NPDC058872 TaxID=3346661 RepID=UPI0036CF721E